MKAIQYKPVDERPNRKVTVLREMRLETTKKLMKNEYPLIFEQISPLFTKLTKIGELRNKFAHSKILPPRYDEDALYMESYKDGKVFKELIDSSRRMSIRL